MRARSVDSRLRLASKRALVAWARRAIGTVSSPSGPRSTSIGRGRRSCTWPCATAHNGARAPAVVVKGRADGISSDRTPLSARVYRREMGLGEAIDITFDFRSDTPPGRDPDALSPTLRTYHQLLWSKPLPSGAPFE